MITRGTATRKLTTDSRYTPFQPYEGWLLRPFRVTSRKVLLPGTKIVASMMPNSTWHLSQSNTRMPIAFATNCTLNIDFVLETE